MEKSRLTINQTGIDIGEKDGGILEENLDRLPHLIGSDRTETHVPLVDLALGLEVGVTRELAEALGASKQDVARARLGHGDKHEDENGSGAP